MSLAIILLVSTLVLWYSYKLFLMYQRRSSLPPGPFPLPVIGNILEFRKPKQLHDIMTDIKDKYGPIYTIFMGSDPTIMVLDPKAIVEGLKNQHFAGRPQFKFTELLIPKGSEDIFFGDFSKEWEALSKVGHQAIRKFAISPILPVLVTETVDAIIGSAENHKLNSSRAFGLLMTSVLAKAAFGKRYAFDDPEFLEYRAGNDYMKEQVLVLQLLEVSSLFKYLYYPTWKKMKKNGEWVNDLITRRFKEAEKKYEPGVINNFADAIIGARIEAAENDSSAVKYMSQQNLFNMVNSLFQAGSDTTRETLLWVFLFMAKYLDMQDRMRAEVEEVIGTESIPSLEHKSRCHFVNSFIVECMRMRNIVPVGFPHKTTTDTELASYSIPKGTTVVFSLYHALHDPESWTDPENFRPERFLVNDKFVQNVNPMFVPFGDGGRRSCPGSKLAFNNLFLVVSRFLQKTTAIRVTNINEIDFNGTDRNPSLWPAPEYEIVLHPRN